MMKIKERITFLTINFATVFISWFEKFEKLKVPLVMLFCYR